MGVVLIAGLLSLVVWGPGSPANRAHAHTVAVTQELDGLSPFEILDQASEARVDLNGCSIYQTTLRIGSPISLSESISTFSDAAQKNGWIRLPGNYAGMIYYFHRVPGEILALYTENIGPREWLQPSSTGAYESFLYLVVASGFNYWGPCKSF